MLGTVLVPFIMSFEKRVRFIQYLNPFIKSNLITAIIFITWDVWFTRKGVWSFNIEYHLGFDIFSLPLEEILFFIFVPYACIFIYEIISSMLNLKNGKLSNSYTYFLMGLSISLIFFNVDHIYTLITFSLLLFLLIVNRNKSWLANFHLSYLICIIPFSIVNGFLTYLPVVLYNDNENLSVRLVSIPFEDIFYGMALILLNVRIYEYFKSKKNFTINANNN